MRILALQKRTSYCTEQTSLHSFRKKIASSVNTAFRINLYGQLIFFLDVVEKVVTQDVNTMLKNNSNSNKFTSIPVTIAVSRSAPQTYEKLLMYELDKKIIKSSIKVTLTGHGKHVNSFISCHRKKRHFRLQVQRLFWYHRRYSSYSQLSPSHVSSSRWSISCQLQNEQLVRVNIQSRKYNSGENYPNNNAVGTCICSLKSFQQWQMRTFSFLRVAQYTSTSALGSYMQIYFLENGMT